MHRQQLPCSHRTVLPLTKVKLPVIQYCCKNHTFQIVPSIQNFSHLQEMPSGSQEWWSQDCSDVCCYGSISATEPKAGAGGSQLLSLMRTGPVVQMSTLESEWGSDYLLTRMTWLFNWILWWLCSSGLKNTSCFIPQWSNTHGIALYLQCTVLGFTVLSYSACTAPAFERSLTTAERHKSEYRCGTKISFSSHLSFVFLQPFAPSLTGPSAVPMLHEPKSQPHISKQQCSKLSC